MVGSHFELSGATCLPKPFQNPHPPIWIGANADPAIERAARMGDCWYINPHNEISTVIRQMEIYKRALDAANKPFRTNCQCGARCLWRRQRPKRFDCAART